MLDLLVVIYFLLALLSAFSVVVRDIFAGRVYSLIAIAVAAVFWPAAVFFHHYGPRELSPWRHHE